MGLFLAILISVISLPGVRLTIVCYHCDNCTVVDANTTESTCNDPCYYKVTFHIRGNVHQYVRVHERGCASLYPALLDVLKGPCSGALMDNQDGSYSRMRCCDENYCNDNNLTINITFPFEHLVHTTSVIMTVVPSPDFSSNSNTVYIVVSVLLGSIAISVAICCTLVIFLAVKKKVILKDCYRKVPRNHRTNGTLHGEPHMIHNGGTGEPGVSYPPPYSSTSMEPVHVSVSSELTQTSGSGAGMPFLVKRTIARSIVLGDSIGGGRFGQVYLGYYQGEKYAVKKFFTKDEQSWFHESDIYSTVNLRHENILTCFATDMLSNNGVTELWLITQYYPRGSLFEELNRVTLSLEGTMKIVLSCSRGLLYLHTELAGTQGKPSIAHRDIKSKNILVKNDGTCCIADFGMAIVKNNNFSTFMKPESIKQGTKRYMSPELLSETINIHSFESFPRSDMYSFGLVLWEVCRRCAVEGEAELEYAVPFHTQAPSDPSIEDMREIVVDKGMNPEIPSYWSNHELLKGLMQIMMECWSRRPPARPTAFYVRKKLDKLADSCEMKLDL